jgi:quercetin dioxygenase-like cupin family protein
VSLHSTALEATGPQEQELEARLIQEVDVKVPRILVVRATRNLVAVVLVVSCGFALQATSAQQPGVKRTELQHHELGVPGREVIQVRVDLDPGVTFPRHSHPGEEVIYVLEGVWEYEVEGQPAVRLRAGDVLFIPAGTVHAAKNVGEGVGSELATYIVEQGKPLVVLSGE